MPYVSRAQQGLFHSKASPVSPKVVKEWDAASRGEKNLPYHVGTGNTLSVKEGAIKKRMQRLARGKR